jgi:hypothetical protein
VKSAIPIAAAVVALLWVPVSPAAQPTSSQPKPGRGQVDQLTIATVPPLAGVRFQVGGQTFASGGDGVASIVLSRGSYPLRLVDRDARRGDVRSTFSRWGDDSFTPVRTLDFRGPTKLEVGFEQSVFVDFAFVDRAGRPVDERRVTRMTLTSTIGSRESFVPGRPRWLIAGRVARRFNGLEQTRIQYALQRAVVEGSNVVHKAQQRFYPADTRHVRLHLLLYSARLGAHDLLFGFRVGKSLDLTYPDGRKVSFPLKGRKLALHSLPRGTYAIKIHASGYSPAVPLALSKDQVIDLRVISYLDLLVMFLVAAIVTVFLVLVRRPHLRARLMKRLIRPKGRENVPSSESGIATAASEKPRRPEGSRTGGSLHWRFTRTPGTSPHPGKTHRAVKTRKTHCAHGHELTAENSYTRPGTRWRECRICRRMHLENRQ